MNFSRMLFHRLIIFCFIVIRFIGPVSAQQNDLTGITHSFFIAGPDFTGMIDEQGKETWNAGQPGARDGLVLPNGNILICWGDVVKEFDKNKDVIFSYKKSAAENELGTAVRLPSGNTFITESGKDPRIVEVDKKGLTFTVRNLIQHDNGQGKPGTGLANLRKRLTLLYEDNFTLTTNQQMDYYIAQLSIPL